MHRPTWIALVAALALLAGGCPTPPDDDAADDDADDDDGADDDGADDDSGPTDVCDDFPGEVICDGQTAVTCDAAGDVAQTDDCDVANDYYCHWGLGCVLCYPGTQWCEGNDVVECDPDGQSFAVVDSCLEQNGEVCSSGECISLCEQAELEHSTVGCLFYAVDTDQHDMGPETVQYAVALSNVHDWLDAEATIESRSGATWNVEWSGTIGAQDLATVNLPDRHVDDSALNDGGAYRVTSHIPIIAYQFNPVDGASSYLSDASLLLPVSAWDSVYRVPGWDQATDNTGTVQHCSLDVVASADATDVTITPSIATLGGGPAVPAGTPGTPFTVHLPLAGDYVQIASNADQQNLGGTLVETASSTPVGVFVGHECALIPTNLCCCDHLEEQIFGIQTWGEGYVAARIPHRGPPVEPCVWQIVAGNDPVDLTFTAHADVTGLPGPTTLPAGGKIRFEVSGTPANPGDFEVSGSDAFLLTQYMMSSEASPQPLFGDPAMVQAVPVEQYLDSYVVLVPGTWENDYLIITRPVGATVSVDGTSVDAWPTWSEIAAIGGGSYEAVRLLVPDGVRLLEGSEPFGVVVVGFDQWDSYAYPGGLDQEQINDL